MAVLRGSNAQDNVNDTIDIENIDFPVLVDISGSIVADAQNHINDGIHVHDVDLSIVIDVAIGRCGIGRKSECQKRHQEENFRK